MDTACWSSTQHGISGSIFVVPVPNAECACDFKALRRPKVLSASVGENDQNRLNYSSESRCGAQMLIGQFNLVIGHQLPEFRLK